MSSTEIEELQSKLKQLRKQNREMERNKRIKERLAREKLGLQTELYREGIRGKILREEPLTDEEREFLQRDAWVSLLKLPFEVLKIYFKSK